MEKGCEEGDEWYCRVLYPESHLGRLARDTMVSIILALLAVALLVVLTGNYPPATVITSQSMEPSVSEGSILLVVSEERSDEIRGKNLDGIIPARQMERHENLTSFGRNGDVILFYANLRGKEVRISHRSIMYVEKGENWFVKANRSYVRDSSCQSLPHCPAPNSGYITKGDNNGVYDQALEKGPDPVSKENVVGVLYNLQDLPRVAAGVF